MRERPYQTLSRDERTRYAESCIHAAWPRWGGALGPLTLLGDGFNTVFRATSGVFGDVALRVHRRDRRTAAQLGVEGRWLERLAAAGFAVPRLIRTADEAPFAAVPDDGDAGAPIWVSVFAWQEGATLATRLGSAADAVQDLTDIGHLGALAARLHLNTAGGTDLDADAASHDEVVGPQTDLTAFPRVPPRLGPLLTEAHAVVDAAMRTVDPTTVQLCHADLHAGNVLVTPGGDLGLIDFDDCARIPTACDLGIAAFYLTVLAPNGAAPPSRETVKARLAALRHGYEALRPWPVADGLLVPFVIARQLYLLNLFAGDPNVDHATALGPYAERVATRLEAWLTRGLT